MKTRKLLKNAKALSPVVASIILIAVTVAVSIAVAAWMAGLIPMFSATEQIQITNMEYPTGTTNIKVTANNTGTTSVIMNEIWINNVKQVNSNISPSLPQPVIANNGVQFTIGNYTWVSGGTYQVKLLSSKGNQFFYSATAP